MVLRPLTLGLKTNEVPEVVGRGLSLWYSVMRLRLDGVYKVREFNSILDENWFTKLI